MTRFFSVLLCICAGLNAISQNLPYGIKAPDYDYLADCGEIRQRIQTLPKEVSFGIYRGPDEMLYFTLSHGQFIEHIFKSSNDGLILDVVAKKQYECDQDTDFSRDFFRGKTVPVLFYKDIKKKMKVSPEGYLVVPVGEMPRVLRKEPVEFNIVFLQKNTYCHYHRTYNLERKPWDLLDMGMMMDSLVYQEDLGIQDSATTKEIIKGKQLKFTIPFERNKSEYSKADMKPLYDSLRLSDFDIKHITINAYASVEGSTEHNVALLEKRSAAIIGALQEYQTATIETEVITAENWVEFYRDIQGTPFAKYGDQSEAAIKSDMASKGIDEDLEALLANHRKAVVTFTLQKKSTFRDLPDLQLVKMFKTKIAENNLEEANQLQNELLYRIGTEQSAETLMDEIALPDQIEYGNLKSNQLAYLRLVKRDQLAEVYEKFMRLDELTPNNKRIQYNLCAIKMHLWAGGELQVDPDDYLRQIKRLTARGVPSKLVKRIQLNYNIIMSSVHMYKAEFDKKDMALSYIRKNYKYVPLKPSDYLSLAQYFSMYARYDWAKDLLAPMTRDIEVDEDILYYYLNLTIIDPDEIKKSAYRMIMLNAIDKNKDRFCHLFDSIDEGGVTFQLLENKPLKLTYCERCQ